MTKQTSPHFWHAPHLQTIPSPTHNSTSIKMAPLYAAFAINISGHLQVSPVHSIYYEECGNPKGVPIIYLHGGPGGGIDDGDRSSTPHQHKVLGPHSSLFFADATSIPPTTAVSSSTNAAPENPHPMPPSKITRPGLWSPTSKPCANT